MGKRKIIFTLSLILLYTIIIKKSTIFIKNNKYLSPRNKGKENILWQKIT